MCSKYWHLVYKYFLSLYGLCFHPLNRVFCRAKVYSCDKVKFIHFSFYGSCFRSKKSLRGPKTFSCFPLSFETLVMVFFLFGFGLVVFVVCVRVCLPTNAPLLQHHLFKKLCFLYLIAFTLLSKSVEHPWVDRFLGSFPLICVSFPPHVFLAVVTIQCLEIR